MEGAPEMALKGVPELAMEGAPEMAWKDALVGASAGGISPAPMSANLDTKGSRSVHTIERGAAAAPSAASPRSAWSKECECALQIGSMFLDRYPARHVRRVVFL